MHILRLTANFKIMISKIQDFENFELSPMLVFRSSFNWAFLIFIVKNSCMCTQCRLRTAWPSALSDQNLLILYAVWVAKEPQKDREDLDQILWMPRLIRVTTVCTCFLLSRDVACLTELGFSLSHSHVWFI